MLAVGLIGGLDAVEEYFPVLAADRGVPVATVPLAVLAISLSGAPRRGPGRAGRPAARPRAPGAARGRGRLPRRRRGRASGPVALAALALVLRPLLSPSWSSPRRACRTGSTARGGRRSRPWPALGIELASLLVFAAWALGSLGAIALLALAAVPLAAVGLRRRR